jgi:mycothiol synthase
VKGVVPGRYRDGVTTPVLPSTLTHRPMRPDDAERWAVLCADAEEADGRGEHYSAADLAEELCEPDLDLEHDTLLVLDGDRAVAYQVLRRPGGTRLDVDAVVHPGYRRRGIGAALMAVALQQAAELERTVNVRVPEWVTGAVALMERAGLVPVRWWSLLYRDLARPVVPVPLAAGLELHPLGPGYDAARWDERLRATRNASFADHWGSAPEDADAFVH